MIFTLLTLAFWLQFFYIFIASIIAFYIPGSILLKGLKLNLLPKLVIGTTIGMVLWAWQGVIFGYLNVRFLSYFYLLIFFIFWCREFIFKKKQLRLRKYLANIYFDKLALVILILGVFLQVMVVFLNGVYYRDGMYFCCGDLSDNIMHLELTNAIIDRIPPYEYLMHGLVVKNYHYWANIVIAELVRVFHLNLTIAQFQFFPVLISLFFGLLAIAISQLLKMSIVFTRWLLFFLYIGGDLIYFLQFVVARKIDFTMGPLETGISFLMNPPRAFAMVILFAGFSLFIVWIRKKDIYTGILLGILLSSLVGFKIYVGIFAGSALAAISLFYLLKRKFYMIIPFIVFVILAAAIFLPVNKSSGGMFWAGFWRFEDFIVHPKLGLSRLELARQVFAQHNNYLRVYLYDLIFLGLYMFAIFGTKLIGLLQSRKSALFFPNEVHIFLLSGIAVSMVLGGFFFQKIGIGNEFNFIVNVYIIGSIYTALACFHWIKKIRSRFLKYIIIVSIVLLTIPRVIYEELHNVGFISAWYGYKISNNELAGMKYMRENTEPSSRVFVYGPQYLSAIAKRPIYVFNSGKADLHGVIVSRADIADTIINSSDTKKIYKTLESHQIKYIYTFANGVDLQGSASASFLKTVYKNKTVRIFKFEPPKF